MAFYQKKSDISSILMVDQILCWELVSKRGGSWILHYVKSAYAITDVPDQVIFFNCLTITTPVDLGTFLGSGTNIPTSSLA